MDAAFIEVFQHGFQGVSIDDIVKRTTLTKGAFFHQFPTKMDLGYALVDEVITPMIIERWVKPLESHDDALDGILQRLQTLIGDADPKELRWGCPLNNLVQEMAPLDAGFRKRLEKALLLWIDEINVHLKRSQNLGFVDASVDTRQVAHFVVMAHEGFYGMLKGLNTPRAFEALFDSLEVYFRSLRPESTGTRRKSLIHRRRN